MSVFVDRSPGVDESTLTTDLFTISWNDGNLGQGADTTLNGNAGGIATINASPVTYTPSVTTGQATANRLFQMVNTSTTLSWGNPILITALAGGIDPYSGLVVTGNGFTYVDTLATPNVIHVVYDTSQNNGTGIALYDTSGDPIQAPNAVILYHELSHAFHNAINQNPFPQTDCPGDPSDEPAAEIDENVLRTQLGLCLRDVCNHGLEYSWGKACGGSATPGGPALVDNTSPTPTSDCLVVTAATGSPQADEIRYLRLLRDRVEAQSRIATDLIAAIYDEYARFAPGVAAAIADDDAARAAVLRLVVRPLFAWYELAERLALHPQDDAGIKRKLEAALDDCPLELAALIVPLLRRLGAEAPSPDAPFAFESLFAQMSGLSRAAWALHAPLLALWTRGEARGGLIEAVAEWLATAPIETLSPPRGDAADRELSELARLFDFAPAARRRLGRRLHTAWPAQAQALRRHGFGDRNDRQPA